MRVRWTEPAARDITQICDYIQEHDTSSTARRVAISIYERLSALMEFPEQGRQGRKSGCGYRKLHSAVSNPM
jgi:plasmid stabilization system protein ParE